MNLSVSTKRIIRNAILAGVATGAHKGDLQDAVSAALNNRRMSVDEAAFAQRTLDATGYVAPTGFKRDSR